MENEEDKKINIALLIDSDNVSAKYISSILSLLSKYGKITIRRMYGDWSQDRLRPWLRQSATYSLEPIMQMNNTPGKNASDIGLIIDAMDILYRNTVGGFCLCSSDGDFNKLAKRLREAGKMVIGMGEKKTPEAFRASCERFIFLDDDDDDTVASGKSAKTSDSPRKRRTSQSSGTQTSARGRRTPASTAAPSSVTAASTAAVSNGSGAQSQSVAASMPVVAAAQPVSAGKTSVLADQNVASRDNDTFRGNVSYSLLDGPETPSAQAEPSDSDNDAKAFTPKADIEKSIIDMITDNSADGKDTSLGEIGSRLQIVYPDFDAQNYGYSKLMNFVKDFSSLSVTNRDNHIYVSLNGSSDSDIEQQISGIFKKHNTKELDLGLIKEELMQINPNLNATIRATGVTRFNVYLNRNIHSVEVNGSTVTLLR
jgi:uncharacterized LabA/DUF88 family protein